MSCFLRLRFALPALLMVALVPAALAQSQDSDSVADAARRARDQKKAQTAPKPAKVFTDDDIQPPSPELPPAVQTAAAPVDTIPGTEPGRIKTVPPATANSDADKAPATGDTSADSTAPGVVKPTPAPEAPAGPDPEALKEIADLKISIKSGAGDLDILQRELALQQDTFYSNTDYAHDTAGKAKLDDIRQQVSDKQAELEKLKARLAELGSPADAAASAAPAPAAPPQP
jgi:hypothetical protein